MMQKTLPQIPKYYLTYPFNLHNVRSILAICLYQSQPTQLQHRSYIVFLNGADMDQRLVQLVIETNRKQQLFLHQSQIEIHEQDF